MTQVHETDSQIDRIAFRITSHPPYSPDLALSDYWLFEDFKRMLQGKRLGTNEEVITEVEAYFESKDKLFYEKGINKLEEH